MSGTLGMISHSKIKGGLNNDVMDFRRFSVRLPKSHMNEAKAAEMLWPSKVPVV